MIEFEEGQLGPAIIRVIGVGGAGGNAINTMIDAGLKGVEFVAVNTDVQDLRKCNAPEKIQIGETQTGGRGAGSNPQVGQQSANEDRDRLQAIVEGANMIKRHSKTQGQTRQAGIIELEAPLDVSKVMLICNKCNNPARVGFRFLEDGKKARICRACGEVVD